MEILESSLDGILFLETTEEIFDDTMMESTDYVDQMLDVDEDCCDDDCDDDYEDDNDYDNDDE